jgi:L-ascorbate metabolism protein UlaG (beta-lactamase superfamily)
MSSSADVLSESLTEDLATATGVRSCGARIGLAALGGKVSDARLERVTASPHFTGKGFVNPIATPQAVRDAGGLVWQYVAGKEQREPREPLPILFPETGSLTARRGEPLRLTWLGHSTVLLDIDGVLVLTDPVFGPRAAPVSWAGPKRFHPPPVPVAKLPPIDVVLVSHDHYDHLDFPTIQALASTGARFVTSLGVGAHLEHWGVPAHHITELDWWEHTEVKTLRITAAPARHFAGRGPGASAHTFWSSWALQGPRHSAWFSGDTGPYDDGFSEIGARFGGFDLSMIEIGAWNPAWGNIHLGPENAVRVHQQVRARTMMPVHWGTFNLALHAWDQPIRHVMALAEQHDVHLLSPMMGQTVHRESGVSPYWLKRR